MVKVKKLFSLLNFKLFFMPIPTNEQIYDAEYKAANCNVSSRTIALSAMFELRKLMMRERKARKKIISISDRNSIG
jgi:hypothetical protein